MTCSYCGHPWHPGPCPRRINDPQRKGGPAPSDCPCIKRHQGLSDGGLTVGNGTLGPQMKTAPAGNRSLTATTVEES